jgi:hypothetical protein
MKPKATLEAYWQNSPSPFLLVKNKYRNKKSAPFHNPYPGNDLLQNYDTTVQ